MSTDSRMPVVLELWSKLTGYGLSAYSYMVWSVGDDRPYWFRSLAEATAYISARERGDEEQAQQIAERAA